MPNPVVHFEIGRTNTEAQQEFYAGLLDWEITSADDEWNNGPVQHSESGIGGGISQSGIDPPVPSITFYVMVDDFQAYLGKAVNMGATQAMPPKDMEVNDSKFSIAGFIDSEGNFIGLFKHQQN